jgi:hypothetical protein
VCGKFRAMSELDKLKGEVAALRAQLTQSIPKDLSLVTLIPSWSGTSASCDLQKFLNSVDTTADLGNWDEKDKIRVATLKLVDTARDFYDATTELHVKDVTWNAFKKCFQDRFRDARTDQFHFLNLHRAHQAQSESVRDFADRVRNLARKITPQTEDPVAQRMCNDLINRMMVAAFTGGLRGNPGDQVNRTMPSTMDEAVRIALTVEQSDSCRQKAQTFYANTGSRPEERKQNRRDSGRGGGPKFVKQATSEVVCYECKGRGHFAKVCPTRLERLDSERKSEKKSDGVPDVSGRKESGRGRVRGRRQPQKPSENS